MLSCWATAPVAKFFAKAGGAPTLQFYSALFCLPNEWMINSTTAIEMHESATLNAGQGSAKRTCRLKRRKSITCPRNRRSVRFPKIPARRSASDISRHRSGRRGRTNRTVTTTNATMEIITKKVLFPLKDPNAAPSLVTLTRLKKSGTTTRAS